MSRVFVLDHDQVARDRLVRGLEREGHLVDGLPVGSLAPDEVLAVRPDLLILDVTPAASSGLDLCRRLRAVSAVPIILMSTASSEDDRIAGFESGADDFVTKPVTMRELAWRINAVLRRGHNRLVPRPPALTDGDLAVDLGAHQVTKAGQNLTLTEREYRLLVFFLQHPRTAFTRSQLLDRVWGWKFGDLSTVTVHARRLREKIEEDPGQPMRLVTVWGVGYRYEPVVAESAESRLDVA